MFTSIPYDVYRYDIVSHPDPDLVGMQVVIRIPREPVTMIAERGFFNAALPSGSTPIGASVFDHTPATSTATRRRAARTRCDRSTAASSSALPASARAAATRSSRSPS